MSVFCRGDGAVWKEILAPTIFRGLVPGKRRRTVYGIIQNRKPYDITIFVMTHYKQTEARSITCLNQNLMHLFGGSIFLMQKEVE